MKAIADNRPKYRIYCPELDQKTSIIQISDSESRHLVKVMRARTGSLVSIFNGMGGEAQGRLLKSDPKRAEIQIEEYTQYSRNKTEFILVQALPKGKTMESILKHCCELGISEIIPLKTENSEFHLEEKKEKLKQDKWINCTIEACKQSCNSFLPTIHRTMKFDEFTDQFKNELILVGAIHPKSERIPTVVNNINQQDKGLAPKIYILIGPEGDFSEKEYQKLEEIFPNFFSLGPLILKVDTATTVSLFTIKTLLEN